MPGLADFLDSLLRGAALLGLSVALGGVAWRFLILGGGRGRAYEVAVRRCLALVAIGAAALATAQLLTLFLKASVLSAALGPGTLSDFAATSHFAAGAARAALGLALAGWALRARRATEPAVRSVFPVALAIALAASGAWLTHAAGRLDHRAWLMVATVAHQAAAALWAGGLAQLAGLWRLARRDAEVDALWPGVVARFSRLALASVLLLAISAVGLAAAYVGSWEGLIGTGYGSLVAIKSSLMGAALFLAVFSARAARSRLAAGSEAGRARLPFLVEAEILFAVMIFFTAASLSAQPPAVDLGQARAAWPEVVEVFRPKWPDLRTPSVATMRVDRAEAAADDARARSGAAYRWSNFSHNVSGLILLGMSALALAAVATGAPWGRFWPLGFVLLAAFIALRASANEGTWPFGTAGLAEMGAEGVQHRIGALLALGLGLLEWRARSSRRPRGVLVWVFPALCAAGGILLLTHSHTAFQPKTSYLVQVTHAAMGALAAVVAAGRWLELRLPPPAGRLAGAAAAVAMLLIALVLVFYREANVVVAPD